VTLLQARVRGNQSRQNAAEEARRYRLLALYARVEEKNAITIQRYARERAAWLRAAEAHAAASLIQQRWREWLARRRGPAAAAPPPALPPPPTPAVDTRLAEEQQEYAATVIQKSRKDALKAEAMRQLKGPIFKRSKDLPRYQRRYLYIRQHNGGDFALCYRVGDVDGNGRGEEKRIPLASCTRIEITDEMRYSFVLDSSTRPQLYRFRCETSEELELWVNGLTHLMS